MPVTLDNSSPLTGSRSALSDGIPMELTQTIKDTKVLTKWESMNLELSDTKHNGQWHIILTASPTTPMGRALIGLESGNPVSEDDGLIIKLEGKNRGEVGITGDGRELSFEEADEQHARSGRPIPRYIAWDFYVTSVLRTNGPEQRFNLLKSAEEQKEEQMGEMAKAIRDAFQGMMPGSVPEAANPQSLLDSMTEEQVAAYLEERRAEEDLKQMQEEAAKNPEPPQSVELEVEAVGTNDPAVLDGEPSKRRGRPRKT